MSALTDLRGLMASRPRSVPGVVLDVLPSGQALVRTSSGVISCATLAALRPGDSVTVQGSLVIGAQQSQGSLPEYRV